ncbi:line-1 retrotransposable element orf2 protein [Phtheirospermum japonicum]|uniref:Line-1 retrotransposable element orf2 protein n=1 Tax=Phtheirospermum japonicum TaxID=374723 RepID=A0A830BVV5_9LAMI|nr:line-1 retrotransposable element orf2 protein [Phtheirospermum japonicum]
MQISLCRKLKLLKGPLKQLNAKHFSHISERCERANKALKHAQQQFHDSLGDDALKDQVCTLRKEATWLGEAERHFYNQQAKSMHLKLSDKCTKFFHSLLNKNTRRNHIVKVKRDDGSFTSSKDEVAKEFSGFYKKLLGTATSCQPIDPHVIGSGPTISLEQSEYLVNNVTDDEIKAALFSIGEEKSSGPNGYTSNFFKKAWQIVGEQFCKAILASRLASTLGTIVDQAQSAFVEGRSMVENIHLAQELLRKYHRIKKVSPCCTLKIDLQKAFNSVSWGFLKSILEGLKFPGKFVSWVMECVTTTSYSISLNGSLHDIFEGKRGLSQGDPLSLFLFALCIEYLSRSLNIVTVNPDLNFHPRCEANRITHLAFADDLMLMVRGDPTSVRILMECLSNFNNKSGLNMNAMKSDLYTAAIVWEDLEEIQDITGIPLGTVPFHYLGIPLSAHKLRVMHYTPFIDKIAPYINVWTTSSLSYAGRAELIRSVLQGVECFWLSIFPLPAGAKGGLGFRGIKAWNEALLTKALWNIHKKKNTLWVRWVHNIYFKNCTLWQWTSSREDSPLLKGLLRIRDKICTREGTFEAAVQKIQSWDNGNRLSIARAYDYFRDAGTTKHWAADVWNAYVTPKHAFTLWLDIKQRLLTRDRLHYLEIAKTCAFVAVWTNLCSTSFSSAVSVGNLEGHSGLDRHRTIHDDYCYFETTKIRRAKC